MSVKHEKMFPRLETVSDITSEAESEGEQPQPPAVETPDETKKKTKRNAIFLTSEQEEDIVNWLSKNEWLYSKGKADFRNKEKKEKAWEDKAEELGFNADELKTWWLSMRTRYGKLTGPRAKSEYGATRLTDRDKWILSNFDFLSGHITRIQGRQGSVLKFQQQTASVDIGQPGTSSQSHGCAVEAMEGDEDLESDTSDLPARTPPAKRRRAASTEDREIDAMPAVDRLRELSESSRALQMRIEDMAKASAEAVRAERNSWGQWMTSLMPGIHPELWHSFRQETLELMHRYETESKNIEHTHIKTEIIPW